MKDKAYLLCIPWSHTEHRMGPPEFYAHEVPLLTGMPHCFIRLH